MPPTLLPPPADNADLGPGLHVNDAPNDDPTRLLVHYDGHIWPWIVAVGLVCSIGGFFVGVRFGTDHYTISTVCEPR